MLSLIIVRSPLASADISVRKVSGPKEGRKWARVFGARVEAEVVTEKSDILYFDTLRGLRDYGDDFFVGSGDDRWVRVMNNYVFIICEN